MDIVIGFLNVLLWIAVFIGILCYVVISVYTCKPVKSAFQVGVESSHKLSDEQKKNFLKSHLQSIKAMLLVQSVLAISIALALYFLNSAIFAATFAIISAINLFDRRAMKV